MAATTMKTKPVDEDREYIAHECVCDVAPRLLQRVWSH
jgi:hypothetical protein